MNKKQRVVYSKKWREKNRQYLYDYKKQIFVELRKLIDLFKQFGCQVNGCTETDPCTLDFHHIEPKRFAISCTEAVNPSFSTLMEEICKCVVICANCHRKVHAGIIKT